MIYVLDNTDASRRSRPWHILEDDGEQTRSHVFVFCTAVFDVRPGITFSGHVESNVCSLCLREAEYRGLLYPDKESVWAAAARLIDEGHIDKHDIDEAIMVAQVLS